MAQRGAERRIAAGAASPYEVTWFNLVDIALFTVLMVAAIVLVARDKEWHRRLVFVAALCLVPLFFAAAHVLRKPDLAIGKAWHLSSVGLVCHPEKTECGGVATDIFFHTGWCSVHAKDMRSCCNR